MYVIALSLSRAILNKQSRDYARMRRYAAKLSGYHIVVLTRKKQGNFSEIHEGNLHVYPTSASTVITMCLQAIKRAINIAHTCPVSQTVLTAQDPFEIGWMCFFVAKVTKVGLHVQVHGDYWSTGAWVGISFVRYVQRILGMMLLRKVASIRVVSKRIYASLLRQGIPSEKMHVLPIRPELEDFFRVARSSRVRDGVCRFLYIGRFAPEKDLLRIIRSFKRVYDISSNTRLRLVGDGSLKELLQHEISRLHLEHVVEIASWTQDVPTCMSDADVLLLASKHEAYALVLVEAMAAGMPVVTTDVGCVGEIVRHGEQGRVVYEHTDEAYAEAMYFFVRDHEAIASYGKRGRETAQKIAATSMESYIDEWIHSVAKSLSGV